MQRWRWISLHPFSFIRIPSTRCLSLSTAAQVRPYHSHTLQNNDQALQITKGLQGSSRQQPFSSICLKYHFTKLFLTTLSLHSVLRFSDFSVTLNMCISFLCIYLFLVYIFKPFICQRLLFSIFISNFMDSGELAFLDYFQFSVVKNFSNQMLPHLFQVIKN